MNPFLSKSDSNHTSFQLKDYHYYQYNQVRLNWKQIMTSASLSRYISNEHRKELGILPMHVDRTIDLIWSQGYSSRNQNRGKSLLDALFKQNEGQKWSSVELLWVPCVVTIGRMSSGCCAKKDYPAVRGSSACIISWSRIEFLFSKLEVSRSPALQICQRR